MPNNFQYFLVSPHSTKNNKVFHTYQTYKIPEYPPHNDTTYS